MPRKRWNILDGLFFLLYLSEEDYHTFELFAYDPEHRNTKATNCLGQTVLIVI
ncbi:hypothetical protein [Robinsoniella peoriensis]|uniref:hypothetical protein n=1 Tax=Robinsoniella peoriensis TaxID=180332 RepID=UPI00362D8F25